MDIQKERNMGKGDARSKRGKLWRGSYGNARPKKTATTPQPKKSK